MTDHPPPFVVLTKVFPEAKRGKANVIMVGMCGTTSRDKTNQNGHTPSPIAPSYRHTISVPLDQADAPQRDFKTKARLPWYYVKNRNGQYENVHVPSSQRNWRASPTSLGWDFLFNSLAYFGIRDQFRFGDDKFYVFGYSYCPGTANAKRIFGHTEKQVEYFFVDKTDEGSTGYRSATGHQNPTFPVIFDGRTGTCIHGSDNLEDYLANLKKNQ